MLRRMYVWEIPVRLTHWVNVLAIVVLSLTGYYIGNPWILVSSREWYGPFFMGNVRFVHFLFAFIFVASLLLRTYWAFVGNEWASWRGLFPFLTAEGRKGIVNAIKYYLFLRREPPEVVGHNALAGMTYAVIVFLYFMQALTGFALLGEVNPAGIWHPLTGWIFRFVTNQELRLVHHLIMWLLFAFVIHHVYAAILIDNEEGNGLLSSIFSGFKFVSSKLHDRVMGSKG
ncbi:MAG: Ni/Fe-hydrogenase, b-type cytochrome subunit [Chloroflexi bacterium]|nr:Ni/Fe-hydrogenase, b-type cytochrome subunit [Chloroflexota bacterium]